MLTTGCLVGIDEFCLETTGLDLVVVDGLDTTGADDDGLVTLGLDTVGEDDGLDNDMPLDGFDVETLLLAEELLLEEDAVPANIIDELPITKHNANPSVAINLLFFILNILP